MSDPAAQQDFLPEQNAPAELPPPVVDPTTAPASRPPRRQTKQLLADEIIADELRTEELIPGAPSRNGGRILTDDRDPWTHNAWDQVEWGEAEEAFAQESLERQRNSPVPQHLQDEFNAAPARQWDAFYKVNKDNFFKDRSWLRTEFPELADCLKKDAGAKRVVEIGCGNGSTLFPLLAANENPFLDLHGYDYSKEAVSVVKAHESFDPAHLTCDVWDLSSPAGPPPTVAPNSVDVLTMIFVLSALHPDEWPRAVENAWTMLKPGGVLLFRDYGRNDLAMLRFKANRYMQDGLYVRGDNTRVYFFERDELVYMFGNVRRSTPSSSTPSDPSSSAPAPSTSSAADSTSAPTTSTTTTSTTTTTTTTTVELENGEASTSTSVSTDPSSLPSSRPSTPSTTSTTSVPLSAAAHLARSRIAQGDFLCPAPFRLDLLQLGVDRRLLLNRKRQLKMMRVWLQGRWRKPVEEVGEKSEEQHE